MPLVTSCPARRVRLTMAAATGASLLLSALPGASALAGTAGHSGRGSTRVVSLFPTNALTVRDRSQLTGRRVALPLPNCTARPTDCQDVRLLDQLDGFDLDPRLALRFSGPVDPAAVAAATSLTRVGGERGWSRERSIGVDRVVDDPTGTTVYAHPATQLAPSTTYRLSIAGRHGSGLPQSQTTFTTESAPSGLLSIRRQLDNGSAFRTAGVAPRLSVDASFPAATTTGLTYTEDLGSGKTATVQVPNTSGTGAGRYVFGSFRAPSWLNADSVIPQTSTAGAGPQVRGAVTLPFVLIEPAGTPPRGGWPVAIFGHGFTAYDGNVFLAADANAARGIATIATDVVGHGFGPASHWNVTSGGTTTSVPAHARGVDQNGDGIITSTEGVSSRSSRRRTRRFPIGTASGKRSPT